MQHNPAASSQAHHPSPRVLQVADAIAQLNSELKEVDANFPYHAAAVVSAAFMATVLWVAAPLAHSVVQEQPFLSFAAVGLAFGFQTWLSSLAAQDAFRRWMLRDRIHAAERLQEAQRGRAPPTTRATAGSSAAGRTAGARPVRGRRGRRVQRRQL